MTTDRSHHAEYLNPMSELASPKGFGDICEKLVVWPLCSISTNKKSPLQCHAGTFIPSLVPIGQVQ